MPPPDAALDEREVVQSLLAADPPVFTHHPGGSSDEEFREYVRPGSTVFYVADGDPAVDRLIARDLLSMTDATVTRTAAIRSPDDDLLFPSRGEHVEETYAGRRSGDDATTPGDLAVTLGKAVGAANAAGAFLAIECRVLQDMLASESLATVYAFLRVASDRTRESDGLAVFDVPPHPTTLRIVEYFPDAFDLVVRSVPE